MRKQLVLVLLHTDMTVSMYELFFFPCSKDHLVSYTVGAFLLLWALIWLYRDSLEIDKIKEKYVFITGCDSGFGNLLCKQLDKRGFHVLAGCLTEKGADDLKRVTGPYFKTCILDVTSTASIQNAVEWTKKEVGERGSYTIPGLCLN